MAESPSFAHQVEALVRAVHRHLSHRRALHVLGVTHVAGCLARRHELGIERAALAALLHDLSKETDPDALRREMKRAGQPIAAEDRDYPRTWHGFHAAAVLAPMHGVSDPAILEAVALHTTADAELGPLARALFVADFCEPNRRIEEAPAVLELALRDLDEGFRMALDLKTRHMLAKRGFLLHPRAQRAMEAWLPATARRGPISN